MTEFPTRVNVAYSLNLTEIEHNRLPTLVSSHPFTYLRTYTTCSTNGILPGCVVRAIYAANRTNGNFPGCVLRESQPTNNTKGIFPRCVSRGIHTRNKTNCILPGYASRDTHATYWVCIKGHTYMLHISYIYPPWVCI